MTDTNTKEPIDLMEECFEKSKTYMGRLLSLTQKLGDIAISRDDDILRDITTQLFEIQGDVMDNDIQFLKHTLEAVSEDD